MTNDVRLRVLGSVLVIISYFIVLHISAPIGAIGNMIGDGISLPFFIRTKSWDVVIMIAFLMVISISRLVTVG